MWNIYFAEYLRSLYNNYYSLTFSSSLTTTSNWCTERIVLGQITTDLDTDGKTENHAHTPMIAVQREKKKIPYCLL